MVRVGRSGEGGTVWRGWDRLVRLGPSGEVGTVWSGPNKLILSMHMVTKYQTSPDTDGCVATFL